MIICCSPTKTMKTETRNTLTTPLFDKEAAQLAILMRAYDAQELATFYKCNEKIAAQNVERFKVFERAARGNAVLSYQGLQFKRMNAVAWNEEQWTFAQAHLRIMSGLYGMLRCQDGIKEYRLDVEDSLRVEEETLENYWRKRIEPYLMKEYVLDCCSKEYSALLPKHKISVVFYVRKAGKLKNEATAAKIARGLLIDYCVRNSIDDPQEVKLFKEDGFTFDEALSDEQHMVFVKEGAS